MTTTNGMDSGLACIILSSCQHSHPFEQRRVCVPADEQVRIGRAVAKLPPAESNFIFDCRVLSRTHAAIWYEDGSFFIKDTKSSNGTFINSRRLSKASEESGPYEIFSGDILQLGVDILESMKSENLKHSCIVCMVRLYHPNGLEALKRGSYIDSTGHTMTSCLGGGNVVQAEEMYQLQLHLRESTYREQLLETKLAALGALVNSTQEATNQCWQVLIDEDRLLSRIQTLEAQLELLTKNCAEDELRQELCRLTVEKEHIASAAKESLQRVMLEKMEAIQRVTDVENMLDVCVRDCSQLRATCEATQNELAAVVEQHDQCMLKIRQLEDSLRLAEDKYRRVESALDNKQAGVADLSEPDNDDGLAQWPMPNDQLVNTSFVSRASQSSFSLMANGDVMVVDNAMLENGKLHVNHDAVGDVPCVAAAVDDRLSAGGDEDVVRESRSSSSSTSSPAGGNQEYELLKSRRRIVQLQEQLAGTRDELQCRAAQLELLESRLKLSDKQLCNLVEEAVGDILRRFEEVIYQKFKNEELILFLKDQVHQLEERFKTSLLCKDGQWDASLLLNGGGADRPMRASDDDEDAVAVNASSQHSHPSVLLSGAQMIDDDDAAAAASDGALTDEAGQHLLLNQQQLPNDTQPEEEEEEEDRRGCSSTVPFEGEEEVEDVELTSCRRECSTLRQRLVTMEQESKNSRKENAELFSQYERLKQSYGALQFDRKALLQKQRTSDQQLDTVRRKNENLAEQLTATQKELKKVADCKALIELENVSLKAKLRDFDSKSGGLAVAEEPKQKPVTPLSMVPVAAVLLLLLSLAIAFYPWLVQITFTDDGPTTMDEAPSLTDTSPLPP